jgi:hypothetical protein
MFPYGNLLKIQRLTLNRFLRDAGQQSKFPYGNFLILWGEFYGDTSNEIRRHKSHLIFTPFRPRYTELSPHPNVAVGPVISGLEGRHCDMAVFDAPLKNPPAQPLARMMYNQPSRQ